MATTQLTQSAARCTTNPTLSGARTALVHALKLLLGAVLAGVQPYQPHSRLMMPVHVGGCLADSD